MSIAIGTRVFSKCIVDQSVEKNASDDKRNCLLQNVQPRRILKLNTAFRAHFTKRVQKVPAAAALRNSLGLPLIQLPNTSSFENN